MEFKGGFASTSKSLLKILLVEVKVRLGILISFSESIFSLEFLHKSLGNLVLSIEINPMPFTFISSRKFSSTFFLSKMEFDYLDINEVFPIPLYSLVAFGCLLSSEYALENIITEAKKNKKKA